MILQIILLYAFVPYPVLLKIRNMCVICRYVHLYVTFGMIELVESADFKFPLSVDSVVHCSSDTYSAKSLLSPSPIVCSC